MAVKNNIPMVLGKELHEKLEDELFTDIRRKVLSIFFDIKLSNDIIITIRETILTKTSQQMNIEL